MAFLWPQALGDGEPSRHGQAKQPSENSFDEPPLDEHQILWHTRPRLRIVPELVYALEAPAAAKAVRAETSDRLVSIARALE